MSPRHPNQDGNAKGRATVQSSSGMDRDRHLEDARHHPQNNPLPHPAHKSVRKPVLPRKHTPHTRPHEEALGPHTGKPGPITHGKQLTRTGTRT